MKRFTAIVPYLALVFALLALAIPSRAQLTSGSLSGTVIDPTGAAVPGATVEATHIATHATATAQTDESGFFKFSFLPVGEYNVQVLKAGFRKEEIGHAMVVVNADNNLGGIKLEIGSATATVEVTAAPPLIEASTSQITNTFTDQDVLGFAGVSENEGLDYLALQVPGVVSTRDLQFSNTNGPGLSVNGLRGENNDEQVDGQNNNDNSIGGPALFLENADWVSEYQIVTNNFGAEYGRNAGSVINEITKSGTNTWHGTVADTETNSVLDTLTNQQKYFEGLTKVPHSNYNSPSTTIGGPLWKDHVFVFGGFDVQVSPSVSNEATGALTPTPTGVGELAGCYPTSAAVTALQVYGPYAIGGGSPQVLGTTQVVDYAGATVPNDGGTGCNVELGGVERLLNTSYREYDWTYKMDLVISNSDRLFGRYIYQKSTYFNVDEGAGAAGYPINVPSLSQLLLVDWTHTFSARAFNQFRASWGRENVEFGGNTLGTVPSQGNIGDAVASITFENTSLLGFGVQSGFPQGRIVNTYQYQDNYSITVGKHQIKAGGSFTRQYSPNVFLPNYNGVYTFSDWGGIGTNTPAYDAITNGNPNLNFLEHDTFLYVGDDWKVKDNLTVNLGLTWSFYGQPFNLIHEQSVKDQTGSAPFWNPSLPTSVTELPSLPSIKNLFGPNIGFAYTPHFWEGVFGHDKTVIRGGYRRAFDPPFYNIYILFPYFAPLSFSQTINPGPALIANPTGTNVRSNLASYLTPGVFDPRNFAQFALTPNFGPDHVQSWSLGVQREISTNLAVEARYVGNHATNLFQSINENPEVDGISALYPSDIPSGVTGCATPAIAAAAGRVNCNQGIVAQIGNYGYSDYNALQTELRATNLWRQLTMRTAYTWSKTTDNASSAFMTTVGGGSSLAFAQNPFNYEGGEHGLSGLNFPQSWTVSFDEHLPIFRNQHGFLGHVFGGWAVAGNYALTSGQGYTPIQFYLQSLSYFAYGVNPPNDYGFNSNIVGLYDFARPFVGNPSAPANTVGVYAGDECGEQLEFGAPATIPVCAVSPTELISLNALNATGAITPTTKSSVRYIGNGIVSDSIFGTPFGTVGRNIGTEAITNSGNFSLYKNIRFNDRAWLQWHMTMLNVFNHPNFGATPNGVDANIEDAGLLAQGVGFGTPYLENGGSRTIYFGLKVIF
ncbi:MAG: carboxypeptidase-like regulatory domain-containing protein [Candidatus Acidiferrales bacterium]